MEPFSGKIPDDWRLGTFSEIIEFHDTKRVPLSNRERANLKKFSHIMVQLQLWIM